MISKVPPADLRGARGVSKQEAPGVFSSELCISLSWPLRALDYPHETWLKENKRDLFVLTFYFLLSKTLCR